MKFAGLEVHNLYVPAGADINPSVATPPVAKKVPKKDTTHGDTRIDNYYWMREKKDPEQTNERSCQSCARI